VAAAAMLAMIVMLAVSGVARAQAPADVDAGVAAGVDVDAGPVNVDGPSLVDIGRPQASAYASPSQLQLGETLTLYVEVVYDAQVTVNIPSTLDLAPAFDELRRTSHDELRTDGTRKRVYELELRAWELGDLTLPPIQVGYAAGGERSWVVTNAVPLRVLGLLGDVDDKTALAGDTPPVSLRRRDWRWVIVAAAVLAVIIIGVVAWRLRKRKKPDVATVMVPGPARTVRAVRLTGPAERALAALAALEKDGVLASEPRAGYERMVGIMRTFWHEQFRVGIRDRTSAELMRAVGKAGMNRPAVEASARWLEGCDLVKYAKVEPRSEESAGDLERARGLVYAAVGARSPAPAQTTTTTAAAGTGTTTTAGTETTTTAGTGTTTTAGTGTTTTTGTGTTGSTATEGEE
jgi:hypothetical protein